MQVTDIQVWSVLTGAVATIMTLAKVLWTMMKNNIYKLEKSIDIERHRSDQQSIVIKELQSDVKRMSYGCGYTECFWKKNEKS